MATHISDLVVICLRDNAVFFDAVSYYWKFVENYNSETIFGNLNFEIKLYGEFNVFAYSTNINIKIHQDISRRHKKDPTLYFNKTIQCKGDFFLDRFHFFIKYLSWPRRPFLAVIN